jgi:hypothetical protein
MTAEEYGLWMADYATEPWGEQRMDVGFAVVASTVANVHRKANAPAYSLTNFMPYAPKAEEAEDDATPAEFIKRLENG